MALGAMYLLLVVYLVLKKCVLPTVLGDGSPVVVSYQPLSTHETLTGLVARYLLLVAYLDPRTHGTLVVQPHRSLIDDGLALEATQANLQWES